MKRLVSSVCLSLCCYIPHINAADATSPSLLCTPTTNPIFEWLTRVKIDTQTINLAKQDYTDATATEFITLIAGDTYSMEMDITMDPSAAPDYQEYGHVYVDLDQSDSIEYAEQVILNPPIPIAPGATETITTNLVIPTSANNGVLYLRVKGTSDPELDTFNNFCSDPDTSDGPWGSVLDLRVRVVHRPSANTDNVSVDEEGSVTIDVLANDLDKDGHSFSLVSFTNATNGTVTQLGDDFRYDPAPDFFGSDSFTYTITDGIQGPSTGTVSITVNNLNDPPTANNDAVTINEEQTAWINVGANDTDPDMESLFVSNVTGNLNGVTGQVTSLVGYRGNVDFFGTETLTYTISDIGGATDTATLTITVLNVNDPPTIVNDTVNINQGDSITIDVLDNDSDVDTDTLTINAVSAPSSGSATIQGNSIRYVSDGAFSGTTTFTYTADDGNGLQDTATVTVNVVKPNSSPTAVNDSFQMDEDTTATFSPLANDFDVDGHTISINSASQPQNGTAQLSANQITYTPDFNFNGNDTFSYTIRDIFGALDTATIEIKVNSLNDLPVANDDMISLNEDSITLIKPLANDVDVDGDALSITAVTQPNHGQVIILDDQIQYSPETNYFGDDSFSYTVADQSEGKASATVSLNIQSVNDAPSISGQPTLTVNQDTPYSFTPNADDIEGDKLSFSINNLPVWAQFNSSTGELFGTPNKEHITVSKNITMSVSDGTAQATLAPFDITVVSTNSIPLVSELSLSLDEDGEISHPLTAVDENHQRFEFELVSRAQFGNSQIIDNTIYYQPQNDYYGFDSIQYRAFDGQDYSEPATITFTINNINDAPFAKRDQLELPFQIDGKYELDVLLNDYDVDKDTLTLTHALSDIGTFELDSDKVYFIAPPGLSGNIDFSYTISDGELSASTYSTITILANPEQPDWFTLPSVITLDARALYTKVLYQDIIAQQENGDLLPVAQLNDAVWLRPGKNLVYWQATNEQNETLTLTQSVNINPLISFEPDKIVAEGNQVSASIHLNGDPIEYPVLVNYTVSGTSSILDHTLSDGTFVIDSGRVAKVTFDVFEDGVDDNQETIVITLDEQHNLNTPTPLTITISEDNLAPVLNPTIKQNELYKRISSTAQTAVIDANLFDANMGDQHQLLWQGGSWLDSLDVTSAQLIVDPAIIGAGNHQVTITATDNAEPSLSTTQSLTFYISEQLPPLASDDSDKDTIIDLIEGHGDTNFNGIANYLDAITSCNVIPSKLEDNPAHWIETLPGLCLRLGSASFQSQANGAQLLNGANQIASQHGDMTPPSLNNSQNQYNVDIYQLPITGNAYPLILPLNQLMKEDAIIEVLIDEQWRVFTTNSSNTLNSLQSEKGFCPDPASALWQNSVNEQAWCLSLLIEDGGPNDSDQIANGVIELNIKVENGPTNNAPPAAIDDEITVRFGKEKQIDPLQNDNDPEGSELTITDAFSDFGEVSIVNNQIIYTSPAVFINQAIINYVVTDSQGANSRAQITLNLVDNQPPQLEDDEYHLTDQIAVTLSPLSNDIDPDNDALMLLRATTEVGKLEIINNQIVYTPTRGYGGMTLIHYEVSDGRDFASATITLNIDEIKKTNSALNSSGSLSLLLYYCLLLFLLRFGFVINKKRSRIRSLL